MRNAPHIVVRLLPFALLLPMILMSGCDGVRETLGFQHNTPDEFAVATAPPLVMPPDYALRPPQPGADPSQSVPAQAQAQAALIGDGTQVSNRTANPAAANIGGGEAALLQAAGSKPGNGKPTGDAAIPASTMPSSESDRIETALFGTPAGGSSAPAISMKRGGGWFDWF